MDSSYSPISMNSAGDFSVAQLSMMTLLECRLLRASLRSVDEHKKNHVLRDEVLKSLKFYALSFRSLKQLCGGEFLKIISQYILNRSHKDCL